MGESRNAYRVLVGRPEGKRPLGRPRRRWEDNIKMDLREVGYDDRDWINLGEEYNACSSALCNFLHSSVTSSLLAPNIFLSILFSNTLNLCSSLKVRVQLYTQNKKRNCVGKSGWKKNDDETDQKEEKELAGSLVGRNCLLKAGRNGERKKSLGQKKISDDRRH
ncbi:hypothetical protein ANN_23147 [Periplaneta americana]|uniref:Uncharacterized protein n=1 Tax=Periplaneta americana TaxID=6978 RepID=A0ABQ8SLE5_PERAM|nr:hypothetical protein ANN_23147 [Periplaneta americana]